MPPPGPIQSRHPPSHMPVRQCEGGPQGYVYRFPLPRENHSFRPWMLPVCPPGKLPGKGVRQTEPTELLGVFCIERQKTPRSSVVSFVLKNKNFSRRRPVRRPSGGMGWTAGVLNVAQTHLIVRVSWRVNSDRFRTRLVQRIRPQSAWIRRSSVGQLDSSIVSDQEAGVRWRTPKELEHLLNGHWEGHSKNSDAASAIVHWSLLCRRPSSL